jgi:hypothetical protein
MRRDYADAMNQPGPDPTKGDASAVFMFPAREADGWPMIGELPVEPTR